MSPETALLLQCARAHPDEEAIRESVRAGIDWRRLFDGSLDRSLLPLLSAALRRACPGDVPAEVRIRLEADARRSAERNLRLTMELLRLLALFEGAGIEVAPLKGPALACWLYQNPGLRQTGDLDILVRPRDLARTRELLEANHCRAESPARDPRFFGFVREINFVRRDGLDIDLHWALAPAHLDCGAHLGEVWRRLVTIDVAGKRVRSLCPEDLLEYLCVHGAKHGWASLSWLADLARLVDACTVDWELVQSNTASHRTRRWLLVGLGLAQRLLAIEWPARVAAAIKADAEAAALLDLVSRRLNDRLADGPGSPAFLRWQFRLLERPADKLRLAWALMQPNARDWDFFHLPYALSAAYLVLKPARLLGSRGFAAARRLLVRGGSA